MNIEFVIQDILYKKNFITIPGFGSLVSKYQSARIIKSDHVKFIPPHKTFIFNPKLNSNDSILITALQTELKLSAEDALIEVEQFVNQSIAILQETKSFTVEGVGTFYYDQENALTFEASTTINYLTDSFGLSEFSIQALPKESVIEEFISKQKEQTTPLHKRIIKAAFIATPIILGALLIPNILHTSQMASISSLFQETEVTVDFSIPQKPIPFQAASNSQESIQSFSTATIIDTHHVIETKTEENKKEIDKEFANETSKAKSIAKETASKEVVTNTATTTKFYIIIGSFASIETAEKLQNELQAQSLQSGIITNDGKIRVYISEYPSKSKASLELAKIKSEYSGAWIYTKKAN